MREERPDRNGTAAANRCLTTGFTDIHTHLLPGVDDGAETTEQALELVRMAYQNGTGTLILTPHYRGRYKQNTPAQLREAFEVFRALAARECPDMQLYLGHEVHYENDVMDHLTEDRAMPINGSYYVLLEFSTVSRRSQVLTGVSEAIRYGYTPIIAHVERYDTFRKHKELVDEVLDMGALVQLNADSIMGVNGFGVKSFCRKLLKEGKVHFIASDAHDADKRPPLLRDCYLFVEKKYGAAYAAQVFYENAQAVIENKNI